MKDRFRTKKRDLLGRVGELETPSGTVKTPALAPVISVSGGPVSAKEIVDMGFDFVITNAYLWMRKGERRDIHSVLGIDKPVMTDSGAYQLLVYKSVDTTNEEIIRYQESINTDIGVVLDTPTGVVAREEAEKTVEKTIYSEEQALTLFSGERTVWTAPIQGGLYPDLVLSMVKRASALDYPLYALGSPTPLMENHRYSELFDVLYLVKTNLPPHKPLHLFGAGHPSIFPFAVALGADTFDSAAYALFAKSDRYMTPLGSEKLQNLKEFPCSCPVCSKYTPEELAKMDKKERQRLLALHNLYVSLAEVKTIRNAIEQGKLWDLVESRARSSPELWEAFKNFKRYSDGFLYSTFVRNPFARGFSVLDEWSSYRPEIMWHLEATKKMLDKAQEVTLTTKKFAGKSPDDTYIVGFPFVLVNKYLTNVYPVYFAKYKEPERDDLERYLFQRLPALLSGKKVRVYGDQELFELLSKMGVEATLLPGQEKQESSDAAGNRDKVRRGSYVKVALARRTTFLN